MWTSTTIREQRTDAVIVVVVTSSSSSSSSTATGIMTRLSSYRRPTLWLW